MDLEWVSLICVGFGFDSVDFFIDLARSSLIFDGFGMDLVDLSWIRIRFH